MQQQEACQHFLGGITEDSGNGSSDDQQNSPSGDGDNNNTVEPVNYSEVENPTGNPSEQGWYELVDENYVLTEDTEVVEGKEYFTLDE